MGHPLGYCVGLGSVASDLFCVDCCLVAVPPVVVGVEIAGVVEVGVWFEEVYNSDYVYSTAGEGDVEKLTFRC